MVGSVSATGRRDHLRLGGGSNRTYKLTNQTVHDDGAVDRLTGSTGRDWFFAAAGDKITDEKANEFAD